MISFLGFLLWFSASFGLQGYGEIYNIETYIHPPVYAEIEIHADNGVIDFYGIYVNEMEINTLTSYTSIQDYFTVGVSVTLDAFTFTLEHMCQHPVGNFMQPLDGEYGGYNKVEIKFSSKER